MKIRKSMYLLLTAALLVFSPLFSNAQVHHKVPPRKVIYKKRAPKKYHHDNGKHHAYGHTKRHRHSAKKHYSRTPKVRRPLPPRPPLPPGLPVPPHPPLHR